MRLLLLPILYTALAFGANAAPPDVRALEALRSGSMTKLIFESRPRKVTNAAFVLADGAGEATLADYRGKYVLLNFWATWCAPCLKEMPMLAALQEEFGGERFQVLTLATGRNAPAAIKAFFARAGVTNLPRHQDPRQAVARDMGVLGLPATILIDPEGREIARMNGDADWSSESARAIIAALLD